MKNAPKFVPCLVNKPYDNDESQLMGVDDIYSKLMKCWLPTMNIQKTPP